MSEKDILKFEAPIVTKEEGVSDFEEEITKENIEVLPDWEEPGSYYRGLKAAEALKAILGKLKLDAKPSGDPVGPRDNVTLNESDAIYFAEPSETKRGQKFLCSIGFDPLPGAVVEKSRLGKATAFGFSGPLQAKEVTIRFAGKEPGKPGRVRHFSPKDFYEWYRQNMA